MKISYAITVCNEFVEIQKLLPFLLEHKRDQDEITILFDINNGDDKVEKYLRTKSVNNEFNWVKSNFKGHFADWKNYLTTLCSGDYIFQIDADEMPHKECIETLPMLLTLNPDVDVMLVPRINTVEGLTQDHIAKWRWRVNEKGWVNWPDYQWRIYRNSDKIKWVNKVHERLEGFDQYATLPMLEEHALYHPKDIERQEKQNAYYKTL